MPDNPEYPPLGQSLNVLDMVARIQRERFQMPPAGQVPGNPGAEAINPWDPLPPDWTQILGKDALGRMIVERAGVGMSPKELRQRGVKPTGKE